MFSFGEKFMELWVQIPTITDYFSYAGMANIIDDVRTRREITETDELTLLEALEVVKQNRHIRG